MATAGAEISAEVEKAWRRVQQELKQGGPWAKRFNEYVTAFFKSYNIRPPESFQEWLFLAQQSGIWLPKVVEWVDAEIKRMPALPAEGGMVAETKRDMLPRRIPQRTVSFTDPAEIEKALTAWAEALNVKRREFQARYGFPLPNSVDEWAGRAAMLGVRLDKVAEDMWPHAVVAALEAERKAAQGGAGAQRNMTNTETSSGAEMQLFALCQERKRCQRELNEELAHPTTVPTPEEHGFKVLALKEGLAAIEREIETLKHAGVQEITLPETPLHATGAAASSGGAVAEAGRNMEATRTPADLDANKEIPLSPLPFQRYFLMVHCRVGRVVWSGPNVAGFFTGGSMLAPPPRDEGPRAFYSTDSKTVADNLAILFNKHPAPPCRCREEKYHRVAGEYSVASEDKLDLLERTRAKSDVERVLACANGKSRTSDADDLESGLSLLVSEYRRADGWEATLRKELGIPPKPPAQESTTADATPPTQEPKRQKRFAAALSFPGEKRAFVEQVAEYLSRQVGRKRVLYDKWYKSEFARPNLDTYLQRLYHDESELIAVFLCADYQKKEWCGLEWRSIRDLIKKGENSTIMFFRFDDAEIEGIYGIDGYISIQQTSPLEVAALIIERLRTNSGGAPKSFD